MGRVSQGVLPRRLKGPRSPGGWKYFVTSTRYLRRRAPNNVDPHSGHSLPRAASPEAMFHPMTFWSELPIDTCHASPCHSWPQLLQCSLALLCSYRGTLSYPLAASTSFIKSSNSSNCWRLRVEISANFMRFFSSLFNVAAGVERFLTALVTSFVAAVVSLAASTASA